MLTTFKKTLRYSLIRKEKMLSNLTLKKKIQKNLKNYVSMDK